MLIQKCLSPPRVCMGPPPSTVLAFIFSVSVLNFFTQITWLSSSSTSSGSFSVSVSLSLSLHLSVHCVNGALGYV